MKSNTDQLAAEAVKQIEKCLPGGALRGSPSFIGLEVMAIQTIIKSAIEKASQIERERADHNADVAESIARASKQTEDALRQQIFELRAAHASEQDDTKRLDWLEANRCSLDAPEPPDSTTWTVYSDKYAFAEGMGCNRNMRVAIDAAMRKNEQV